MNTTLVIKGVILFLIVVIVTLCLIFLRKKRKEITLVIISSGIALIVGEFALRYFLPQTTDYGHMIAFDPTLGWKLISDGKGVMAHRGLPGNAIETNSWGFRDHPPLEKRKNKLMVLGDSFVANIAVQDNEVFTEIMEGQLEAYDVMNFGVNGYGQVQEYLLIEKWIDVVDPDVMVLMIYLQNDFADNTATYGFYPRPFATLEGGDSVLTLHKPYPKIENDSHDLLSKSHVNWLVTRAINNLFFTPDSSYATESNICQSPIPNEHRMAFKIMEELLIKIARVGKEKNVPVIFALAPSILQVDDELWKLFLEKNSITKKNYMRSAPNDRLTAFAKANNLLMLDLLPVFLEEEKRNVKCYHPVEQHWTKEGNQVVANALVDYLESKSFIE